MTSKTMNDDTKETPILIPTPVSASDLVDQELERREWLRGSGNILTGCREVDEYVLLGGFERGSVVGVSVEEDEMGLLIGLQTVAHLLVTAMLKDGDGRSSTTTSSSSTPKATIITMLPVNILLPKLRKALVSQLASFPNGLQNIKSHIKRCMEGISISMVFDIEGLREVLGEISSSSSTDSWTTQGLRPPSPGTVGSEQQRPSETASAGEQVVSNKPASADSSPLSYPPPSPPRVKTEIMDSEDEEDEEPLDPDPILPPITEPAPGDSTQQEYTTTKTTTGKTKEPLAPQDDIRPLADEDKLPSPSQQPPPDIILITHMSSLLNGLFTGRDQPAAHQTMSSLSAQLRHLTRGSPSPKHHGGGPLVMILNSATTTTDQGRGGAATTTSIPDKEGKPSQQHHDPGPGGAPPAVWENEPAKSIAAPSETTPRSIFTNASVAGAKSIKPSFGMVFAQLLDLHLLCTRAMSSHRTAYSWIVEVLLDEMGVYEYNEEEDDGNSQNRIRRQCREQRWGAVDAEDGLEGGRIVDFVVR